MNKLKQVKTRTLDWKKYAEENKDEFLEKLEMLKPTEYNLNNFLCAKSYSELNQYINNRHFAGEVVKKLW